MKANKKWIMTSTVLTMAWIGLTGCGSQLRGKSVSSEDQKNILSESSKSPASSQDVSSVRVPQVNAQVSAQVPLSLVPQNSALPTTRNLELSSQSIQVPTSTLPTQSIPVGQGPGYAYESRAPQVGPRIGLPNPTGCDSSLFTSFTRELLGPFPSDVACNTIGKSFLISINYQGLDNLCYRSDLTGTFQIACTQGLPRLNATSSISFSALPAVDQNSIDWNAAGARCWHTAGDRVPDIYGVGNEIFCGGRAQVREMNLVSGASGPAYSYESRDQQVGPRIGLPNPTGCDSSLFTSFTRELLGPFPSDVACNTIGKNFVISIAYQGSDNKCYRADLTGTFQITCVPGLPRLNATTSIAYSALPTVDQNSFDWNAASAKCWHTAGDRVPDIYGVGNEIFCGGRAQVAEFNRF